MTHIQEGFKSDDIVTLYTTSKDEQLDKYYYDKSLRFAENAGCQYSLGVYGTFEMPGQSGDKWKDRSTMYGNYIYEFELNSKSILYFDYEDFTHVFGTKIKEADYISWQWEHYKLKAPSSPVEFYADLNNSNSAQRALKFYRYIRKAYTQNEDGTLNMPINAFVYTGKQDGHTVVVVNPYALVPVRVTDNGGESWRDMDRASDEYLKYIEEAMSENDISIDRSAKDAANNARTFDNNPTPEKAKVYELLQSYGESGYVFLGQFSKIVIYDNKTIDLKYHSSVPAVDDYRHYFRVVKDPALDEIFKMGYKINKLEGGLKFGSETKRDSWGPDNWKDYVPTECTGGIAFRGVDIDKNLKELLNTGVKFADKTANFKKCEISGMTGFDRFERLEFDTAKPTYTTKKLKANLEEQFDETFDGLQTRNIEKLNEAEKKKDVVQYKVDKMPYIKLLKTLGFKRINVIESGKEKEQLEKYNTTSSNESIAIYEKDSTKNIFMNIVESDFDKFIKSIKDQEKRNKSISIEKDSLGNIQIRQQNSVNITFNDKVLRVRPTSVSTSGKAGLQFEDELFKQLYIGSGRARYNSTNNKEQQLKDDAESLLENKEYVQHCKNTFLLLKQLIENAYSTKRKKLMLSNYARVYSVGDTLKRPSTEVLGLLLATSPFASENTIKKADIYISFSEGTKSKDYTQFPISCKQNETGSNGGERSQGVWVDTFNKYATLKASCYDDIFSVLDTKRHQDFLQDIITQYVGDTGMIYAYDPSDSKNKDQVVFKFKTPVKDLVISKILFSQSTSKTYSNSPEYAYSPLKEKKRVLCFLKTNYGTIRFEDNNKNNHALKLNSRDVSSLLVYSKDLTVNLAKIRDFKRK